jgi:hypothetical protein
MADSMRVALRLGWGKAVLFAVAVAAVVWTYFSFAGKVGRIDYLSGWALLAVMLFLALYNGRKKLPFLPLGSSELWLQLHVWLGYFALALFVVHLQFRMPSGWFEIALALLFGIVMASGIFGLVLSRQVPKRLTTLGSEVLFERIPAHRRMVLDRAEKLALSSSSETQAATLLEFYAKNLRNFFASRPPLWRSLLGTERGLFRLLEKVEDLKRYTNTRENEILAQWAELAREKHRLEYHCSLQGILKAWLFVHIPFTYSLLLFSFVHVLLVFAFSSGAP